MRKNRGIFFSLILAVLLSIMGCGFVKVSEEGAGENTGAAQVGTEAVEIENSTVEVSTEEGEGTAVEETTEVTESTESNELEEQDKNTESKSEIEKQETENNAQTGQNNQNSNVGNSNQSQSSEQAEREFVGQYWETEVGDFVPFKYGITRSEVNDIEYYEYSDGTSDVISVYTYYDYDCSGYNATDADLKAESEANAANYISYYNEVLRLTNEIRAEAGVGPLTLDTTLCKAACMRSLEMDYAQKFSHTRPNGSSCFTAMDYFGCSYTTCGENIAAGYSSPASVVEGWKNSPGHYANMINPDFTKLGVGYTPTNVEGEYWYYWTQLFSN